MADGDQHPVLQRATWLMQQQVASVAGAIDRQPAAMATALEWLGQAGLLAVRVPCQWGGADLSSLEVCQFQEILARFSGALAFVQAQHQSAGAMLSRSGNSTLQQQYLPNLASGQTRIGIAFAHLRRSPSPLQAIPVPGGYELHGQVPWATGLGYFQQLIVAARLPDDRCVYGLVPFCDQVAETGGSLIYSSPMALAAMPTSQTVSLTVNRWRLPESQVVAIQPADALARQDRLNCLSSIGFVLGNLQASLDIVAAVQQQQGSACLTESYRQLQQQGDRCRAAIYAALEESGTGADPLDPDRVAHQLALRGGAIALSGRCAHAAVAISAGAANSADHPAQRVYRDALVFTVSGQTVDVMAATLASLVNPTQWTLPS